MKTLLLLILVVFSTVVYSQQNTTSDKQLRRLTKTLKDFNKLLEMNKIPSTEVTLIWNNFIALASEFPLLNSKFTEDQIAILSSWISSHQEAYIQSVEYLESKNRFYIFQQ